MSLVSKWILGRLGRLRAVALSDPAAACIELPPPDRHGGLPLMQALALRHSQRDFAETPLSLQQLSELLWAADGINRPELHERTAHSAMNAQEIGIYVALASGLYRYDVDRHALLLVAASDARQVTGLQDFVDAAPLDLVYVADDHRMRMIPEGRRGSYSALCAGAIMQNVYLYCASAGLISVARGLFDEDALRQALGLSDPGRFERRRQLPGLIRQVLSDISSAYLAGGLRDVTELADPLLILERDQPVRPLPAFFAFVGTKDPVLDDTRRVANALARLHVPHEVRYYPGELHAFHALMMRRAARDCWRDKLAFLERQLAPDAAPAPVDIAS